MSQTFDAMILAAGAGSRLAPLTNTLAKPLIPLFGKTLLARAVERAAAMGAARIIVNTHYHRNALAAAVAAMQDIRPAPELSPEDIVLGPIGGIRHALPLFRSPWVLVMNADAYLDNTPPALVQAVRNPPAPVTFLTSARESDAPQVLGLNEDWEVTSVRGIGPGRGFEEKKAGFLGVSLWEKRVIETVISKNQKTPLDLVPDTIQDLYNGNISIKALSFTGHFCDVGTPERLLALHSDMLLGKLGEKADLPQRRPGQHIGPFAAIHPSARITGPVYLSPHCKIEAGVRLKGPVSVGEGCVIGEDSVVENAMVFEGSRVPEGSRVKNQLVFNHREAG